MARICVFVGSIREGRRGKVVADWVASTLKKRGHEITVIDPNDHVELQTLSQMYKSMSSPSDDMKQVHSAVQSADGYVAVSPEYNHSYSGALKNALDHFLEEYAFKPFFIVTYSAGGFGGIRAAEHLRCVVAELGAPAIPTSLPVSKVFSTFSDEGVLQDKTYADRLAKALDEFEWYVDALASKRAKGTQ